MTTLLNAVLLVCRLTLVVAGRCTAGLWAMGAFYLLPLPGVRLVASNPAVAIALVVISTMLALRAMLWLANLTAARAVVLGSAPAPAPVRPVLFYHLGWR